jgi:hypothetical protein
VISAASTHKKKNPDCAGVRKTGLVQNYKWQASVRTGLEKRKGTVLGRKAYTVPFTLG